MTDFTTILSICFTLTVPTEGAEVGDYICNQHVVKSMAECRAATDLAIGELGLGFDYYCNETRLVSRSPRPALRPENE